MSERRHTADLLGRRLAENDRKKAALDKERAQIYAAAEAAGLSRADVKYAAARYARAVRREDGRDE